ncbi:AfsR/SARP family transcriptional regulator [Natronoglycomyces albus]|uniref:Winged helix-turn-helix domain-containing protein n=1 Tax=Natronoglycomyces albus TaxID=2811108 RepID=A0A895XEW7_9ACTN|nr:BTAD domain-containing putative transcriptional regulator [Natronoglycomyces albus]QSB04381.1 winged helix-turn-helix domain-containing protein [Natronoglycomyces albus]
MRIQLCGPVTICGDGAPLSPTGRKQRGILALLAVNSGQTVSTETMINCCWDNPPSSARANVRSYVASLRRDLESASHGSSKLFSFNNRCGSYRLSLGSNDVDITEISRLVNAAKSCLETQPETAVSYCLKAKRIWHGDPGNDLPNTSWFAIHTMNLQELRQRGDKILSTAHLLSGHPYHALPILRNLLGQAPQHPQYQLLLAAAHYLNKQTPEALHVIRCARESFNEMGLDLPNDVNELLQAILNSDTELVLQRIKAN